MTRQAPLSRRVSRRESWSGLPFPSRTVHSYQALRSPVNSTTCLSRSSPTTGQRRAEGPMSAGSPGPGTSWNTTLWRSPLPPFTPALHRSSKAPLSCPEALCREDCCFPACSPSMRLTLPLGRRGFLLRALGKPSRWLFSRCRALLVGRGPGAAPRGPAVGPSLCSSVKLHNEAGEWDVAGRRQQDPGQRAVWVHPGVFG